jgi:DNA-binding LytR/AlgR family response regulator
MNVTVVSDEPCPRLILRDGRRTHLVPTASVLWIESYGNYVRVHTDGARYLHRTTIARLAEALAPHGFWRIHRRVVVNGARVRTFRPRGHCREAVLETGHVLRASRGFQPVVAGRLDDGRTLPDEEHRATREKPRGAALPDDDTGEAAREKSNGRALTEERGA